MERPDPPSRAAAGADCMTRRGPSGDKRRCGPWDISDGRFGGKKGRGKRVVEEGRGGGGGEAPGT